MINPSFIPSFKVDSRWFAIPGGYLFADSPRTRADERATFAMTAAREFREDEAVRLVPVSVRSALTALGFVRCFSPFSKIDAKSSAMILTSSSFGRSNVSQSKSVSGANKPLRRSHAERAPGSPSLFFAARLNNPVVPSAITRRSHYKDCSRHGCQYLRTRHIIEKTAASCAFIALRLSCVRGHNRAGASSVARMIA